MFAFYSGFSKLLNFLQGLIFVVDSNDRERIQEAAEELQKMVNVDTFLFFLCIRFLNRFFFKLREFVECILYAPASARLSSALSCSYNSMESFSSRTTNVSKPFFHLLEH